MANTAIPLCDVQAAAACADGVRALTELIIRCGTSAERDTMRLKDNNLVWWAVRHAGAAELTVVLDLHVPIFRRPGTASAATRGSCTRWARRAADRRRPRRPPAAGPRPGPPASAPRTLGSQQRWHDDVPVLGHMAARGEADMVDVMLERFGLGCDEPSPIGRTAIHCAARWDRPNVIAVLIKHGALLDGLDSLDMSALDIAVDCWYPGRDIRCIQALGGAGARIKRYHTRVPFLAQMYPRWDAGGLRFLWIASVVCLSEEFIAYRWIQGSMRRTQTSPNAK